MKTPDLFIWIFMLQAQQTAVLAGVVGVEDGADGLGLGALAIEWLKDAGLIYKVNRCKKALLPFMAMTGSISLCLLSGLP